MVKSCLHLYRFCEKAREKRLSPFREMHNTFDLVVVGWSSSSSCYFFIHLSFCLSFVQYVFLIQDSLAIGRIDREADWRNHFWIFVSASKVTWTFLSLGCWLCESHFVFLLYTFFGRCFVVRLQFFGCCVSMHVFWAQWFFTLSVPILLRSSFFNSFRRCCFYASAYHNNSSVHIRLQCSLPQWILLFSRIMCSFKR